jgi:hypothetical protein
MHCMHGELSAFLGFEFGCFHMSGCLVQLSGWLD